MKYPNTPVECLKCSECAKIFWRKNYFRKFQTVSCSRICQNALTKKHNTGQKRLSKTYKGELTKSYKIRNNLIPTKKKLEKTINCIVCNLEFNRKTNRKTCSRNCHMELLQGKIGHTKKFKYINPDGREITLGSSWEYVFAKFLDEQNIYWIRPKSLKWIDVDGKEKNYFPDFYIPSIDCYFDPKNPLKIQKDHHKIEYFKGKIQLFCGDLKYLKEMVRTVGNAPTQSR